VNRRVFLHPRVALVAATMSAAVVSGIVTAQQAPPQQPNFDAVTVRSFKVQDQVFMLAGAGGNVTVQTGNSGVLVVDTQFAQMADKLLAEIARLSGNKPIRYVINTHVHPDHVGGNERLRRAGRAIVAGNVAGDVRGNEGATVIAHETVAARMSRQDGTTPPAPGGALPTETFFGESDEVFFNGEAVRLIHQPAAHTDGDVMVFFRKSDVIATGDVYVNTSYPVIDTARGGTINGIIAGLNRIIEITVPRDKQEGGTMVIPGHGRIADEADVVEYRDMVTIIRDRVRDMMKKGMTLQQIKAAGPTSDYDGRYGATSGFWTTDNFVEAVYRTLGGK
jgi:glyoxylase-like metal-dependent hydrolase (beta-lactamase superfamily II)